MYSAAMILLAAAPLAAGGWLPWTAWALLAAVLDRKARREEALLAAQFPGYVAYAHRTRRFIPGIY
jgi:protein-S-isoprenylcysteine O-methyltransferase Ste14